ncbi:MAG: cell wall hydrolase [Parasphingorhabdus sp.]
MSTIFKTASVASLAIMTSAALSVTDVSFAFEANDEIPEQEIVVDPAALEAEQAAAETPIIFAKPLEVVAEIPAQVIEADKVANKQALEESQASADFVNNGAKSLQALVRQQSTSGTLSAEMHCLAGAVYFESKGESLQGQLAVARVVLARAKSTRFPNSICGVVYQRKQFSFVRGGKMPRINKRHQYWRNAVAISKIAKNDAWKSPVEGALFFHARYVSPGWRLTRMATIDNHIFYR